MRADLRLIRDARRLHPADQLQMVIDDVHRQHPGRMWRQKWHGTPRWLDDEGILHRMSPREFRALVSPGLRVARGTITDAFHDLDSAPPVRGVIRCPWVTADGHLSTLHRHEVDGWVLHCPGPQIRPDLMTDDQARRVLDFVVKTVPLPHDKARRDFLGALLRCVQPPEVHASPVVHLVGNDPDGWHTIAARIVGAVLLGRDVDPRVTALGLTLDGDRTAKGLRICALGRPAMAGEASVVWALRNRRVVLSAVLRATLERRPPASPRPVSGVRRWPPRIDSPLRWWRTRPGPQGRQGGSR